MGDSDRASVTIIGSPLLACGHECGDAAGPLRPLIPEYIGLRPELGTGTPRVVAHTL